MALPSQGMMLSERPSGSLGRGSPLAGEGSIGNYKGVMLCNRPFAGTAAASKGGGGDGATASGKHVFVTGKVKSEVGFAGKNLQNEKLLRKRVKQETALTRHRRWLADLQLTKQALEEKYMEDLQRKDENKKRFAKREAQMRQMTRELAQGNNDAKHCGHDGDSDESIAAPIHDGSVRDHQERGSQAWAIGLDQDSDDLAGKRAKNRCEHRQSGESKQDDDADGRREDGVESPADSIELRAVEKRRKRDGKPCRPMWAMTETKAVAETERKHEEELEVSRILLLKIRREAWA